MASRKKSKICIDSVSPSAVIPGGRLTILGSGMGDAGFRQPEVLFGDKHGRVVSSDPGRVVVTVPDTVDIDSLRVRFQDADSGSTPFGLGSTLGTEFHPVANPAVDAEGNVFTTQSGARGKSTPVSVFRVALDASSVSAFVSGVVNPTGLLVLPDGNLLVSSRHTGTVYEVAPSGEKEVFAEGMGVATGLTADPDGNVYVGDRTGTVFKINRARKIYVFATLEPSVAAYHLATGPDGALYVTGPSTSSYDAIHRIDPDGNVSIWRRGFGRPQGIALDGHHRLHVCASHRGQRGIFRVTETGVEQVVSGQNIVGLAFALDGSLVVATSSSLYHVPSLA